MINVFNDIARKFPRHPRFIDHRGYAWGQHGYIGYTMSPASWVGRSITGALVFNELAAGRGWSAAGVLAAGLFASAVGNYSACMTQWTGRPEYMVLTPLDRWAQEKTKLLTEHHKAANEACRKVNIRNIGRGALMLGVSLTAIALSHGEFAPFIYMAQAAAVFTTRFVDGLYRTSRYGAFTVADASVANAWVAEQKAKRTAPVTIPAPVIS